MRLEADMMPRVEPARATRGSASCTPGAQSSLSSQELDAADDVVLLQGIGQGDAGAFRRFAERHLDRCVRFAARLLGDGSEAEDAVQEAFLRVWTGAAKFTPRARPTTWLYRIVRNQCIDRVRARRAGDPDALERQSAGDRPSTLLARKQTAAHVAHALAALPERQRAALALIHYEGLGNIEAADVLEVSVEALESLLSRGRRAMREALAAHVESEGEGA